MHLCRRPPRVLNNNPETFGPEHQLISYFALDDVQILELLKAKLSNSAAGYPLRFSRYAGKRFPEKGHPELRIDQRWTRNQIEVKNKDPDRKFLKEHGTKKRKRIPGAEDMQIPG